MVDGEANEREATSPEVILLMDREGLSTRRHPRQWLLWALLPRGAEPFASGRLASIANSATGAFAGSPIRQRDSERQVRPSPTVSKATPPTAAAAHHNKTTSLRQALADSTSEFAAALIDARPCQSARQTHQFIRGCQPLLDIRPGHPPFFITWLGHPAAALEAATHKTPTRPKAGRTKSARALSWLTGDKGASHYPLRLDRRPRPAAPSPKSDEVLTQRGRRWALSSDLRSIPSRCRCRFEL